MKTEITDLTPELAQSLLSNAARNRNVSEKLVHAYARDMRDGRWSLNGETIKVNRQGQLFDGKHRCLAVVSSGATIPVVIVRDAEEGNVDSGRPRSYGDILAIEGTVNARNYAAVVKAVTSWRNGNRPARAGIVLTVSEKEETRFKYPEITESVRVANIVKAYIPVAPSVIGLCHWLFWQIDPEQTDEFMNLLAKGAGLEEGHPILTLRNRIARERIARRGPLHDAHAPALIILAWNAYREHRPMSKLQLPTPLTSSNFPEPR